MRWELANACGADPEVRERAKSHTKCQCKESHFRFRLDIVTSVQRDSCVAIRNKKWWQVKKNKLYDRYTWELVEEQDYIATRYIAILLNQWWWLNSSQCVLCFCTSQSAHKFQWFSEMSWTNDVGPLAISIYSLNKLSTGMRWTRRSHCAFTVRYK